MQNTTAWICAGGMWLPVTCVSVKGATGADGARIETLVSSSTATTMAPVSLHRQEGGQQIATIVSVSPDTQVGHT